MSQTCERPNCETPTSDDRYHYCSEQCREAGRLDVHRRYNRNRRPQTLTTRRLIYLLSCEATRHPPLRCVEWRKTAPLSPTPTPEKETA